jgi:lipopolysaccharide transport system permease protein
VTIVWIVNHIRYFIKFLSDLFDSRAIILELTKQDFKAQYLGSYLGLVWAFVNPAVTVLVFWFVFQVGFKSRPVGGDFPFVLWLMAGIFPWFFFAESVGKATRSVIEKNFLVKKVVFRVSILPLIKILSSLTIHLFFMGILIILFLCYGYTPQVCNVQVLYYLFAMIVFLVGLSWLTSSLTIFLRDTEHVVDMTVQFGFWMTPVFWSIKMLPERYRALIQLNPAYYFVEGYRDSFINRVWFWEHPWLTLYFWSVTAIIFVTGALLFRRLRPHFADVL